MNSISAGTTSELGDRLRQPPPLPINDDEGSQEQGMIFLLILYVVE